MSISINGKSDLGQMFNASLEAAKKRPGNDGEASAFEIALKDGLKREIGGNGYNIQLQDIDNDGIQDLTGFPSFQELQESWFKSPDKVSYEEIKNDDGSISYKFTNDDLFELTYNDKGELASVIDPKYALYNDWVSLDSNLNAEMDTYYDQETFKTSENELLTLHYRDDDKGYTNENALAQTPDGKFKIVNSEEELHKQLSKYWKDEE